MKPYLPGQQFNHAAMPHLAITATILECDENAHTRKQEWQPRDLASCPGNSSQ